MQKRYLHTKKINKLDIFLNKNNIEPLNIYNDLHLNETKTEIRNKTQNLSGIYLIYNNLTGDYYIGSASSNKIYSRFYRHLINFTGSKIIKLAVKKYKLKNFSFLILEIFTEKINKENNKKLLDLEDFYLKSLLPNYNILTEAGSNFGYKHTEIDRIKMKTNYSQERRNMIGNLNNGKMLTESTKSKLREKALSRSTRIYTKKGILNMKKNSKPIIIFNKDNTVYGEYPSIRQAAHFLNCGEKTIRKALISKNKILKRR